MFKKLPRLKLYKVQHLRRHQTSFQTSGHRIGEIWPEFLCCLDSFPRFLSQGAHFWGQKRGNYLHAIFCVLGDSFRGGSQKRISKFDNPVIRPVFHR